jgi:PKHD-type hydroxylase
MYVFRPAKSEKFTQVCWYEGVIQPNVCDDIIAMFDEKNPVKAGMNQNNRDNDALRKSEITWIHYNEQTNWVFEMLSKYVFEVNNSKYHFELSGFYEALQLTKYPPGGHYTWHADNLEPDFTTRKLSVVLQLSDPNTFSGGELVIFPNTKPPRTRGSICLFPPFVTHKVNPVEQGIRYSLVGWVTGPAFR